MDRKLYHYYHYRDSSRLECDTVLHRRKGTHGLIEVKLGGETRIEEGATNLKNLAERIDTTRMPNPSFMMVVVGKEKYAYRRKDGVYVVPVGVCDRRLNVMVRMYCEILGGGNGGRNG